MRNTKNSGRREGKEAGVRKTTYNREERDDSGIQENRPWKSLGGQRDEGEIDVQNARVTYEGRSGGRDRAQPKVTEDEEETSFKTVGQSANHVYGGTSEVFEEDEEGTGTTAPRGARGGSDTEAVEERENTPGPRMGRGGQSSTTFSKQRSNPGGRKAQRGVQEFEEPEEEEDPEGPASMPGNRGYGRAGGATKFEAKDEEERTGATWAVARGSRSPTSPMGGAGRGLPRATKGLSKKTTAAARAASGRRKAPTTRSKPKVGTRKNKARTRKNR